jgi:hypothetical protein
MDFGRIANVEVSEGMVGWIAIELKGDSFHALTACQKVDASELRTTLRCEDLECDETTQTTTDRLTCD